MNSMPSRKTSGSTVSPSGSEPGRQTSSSTRSIVTRCVTSRANRVSRPSGFGAILLAGCVICAGSQNAFAQAPEITTILEGEPAPFTGDLYPVDVSVRIALQIENCQARSDAALDHARKIHEIELAKAQNLAKAAAEGDRRRLELAQGHLDAATAWYRSPTFVASVSATVAIVALLASAYLVQATLEAGR